MSTEYTSLDISKRLAGVGFKVVADGRWVGRNGKPRLWKKGALPLLPIPSDDIYLTLGYAYRSDTLLEWLMKQDAGAVVAKVGLRTLCENGRYGYVQIDVLDTGEWNVSLFRPMEVRVTALTLPDALGDVILAVLAREAKHD